MNAKFSFGYFTHLLTINILADISMYVCNGNYETALDFDRL